MLNYNTGFGEGEKIKNMLIIETDDLESTLGSSPKIQKVIRLIQAVAPTDVNVLLTGESGTGKELVARIIHGLSARKEGPFLPIDCAAIPETLIESELFGHEKGAFTGATSSQKGKFEIADRGTILLDEVANIPLPVQAKLLRFMERHEFERIGGDQAISADVRVIAASNRNLNSLVQDGSFRSDLYFRLNEFPIVIPPLRKRGEDIPFLCKKLLSQLEPEIGRQVTEIAPEALQSLQAYDFPGNVRELKNILKRAMVVATERIELPDLPQEVRGGSSGIWMSQEDIHVPIASDEIEKHLIQDTLKQTNGHREKAAQLLGITRRTLYSKIKKYGL